MSTQNLTASETRIVQRLGSSLGAICALEIARGNRVCEVWEGDWPRPDAVFVRLEKPFARIYDEFPDLKFCQCNDPHYWKHDYSAQDGRLILACGFK